MKKLTLSVSAAIVAGALAIGSSTAMAADGFNADNVKGSITFYTNRTDLVESGVYDRYEKEFKKLYPNVKSVKVVAFADLGMEAIYKFVVKDMPVSVAVDVNGTSVHATAPKIWQAKIGKIPVVDAAAN